MWSDEPSHLQEQASALRREALDIVDKLRISDLALERFGSATLVGSVDFDLMTWRDIDIYILVQQWRRAASSK